MTASPTEALSSTGLHPKAGLALLPACLGKEVHPFPVTVSCREQAEGKYWSRKAADLVLGSSTLSPLKFSHPGNKLVPRSGM